MIIIRGRSLAQCLARMNTRVVLAVIIFSLDEGEVFLSEVSLKAGCDEERTSLTMGRVHSWFIHSFTKVSLNPCSLLGPDGCQGHFCRQELSGQ